VVGILISSIMCVRACVRALLTSGHHSPEECLCRVAYVCILKSSDTSVAIFAIKMSDDDDGAGDDDSVKECKR